MNNDKLKEKYKRTKLRDKIKLSSRRVKYNSTNQDDEDNNASSYANNVLEDAVSNTSASAKDLTVRRIKDRAYNKKLSTDTNHTVAYSEKGRAFAVDIIRRKTSSNQYTVKSFIKNITEGGLFKHTTAVKPMFVDNKILTAALFGTGGVAVISVILVCLIALMTGSPFGVFMSTEDTGTGYTLTSVVQDINAEYLAEIEKIKMDNPHDSFEVNDKQPVWKEIIAIYAVVSSCEGSDTVTIDTTKSELFRQIFWDAVTIQYSTEIYEETITEEYIDEYGEAQMREKVVQRTKLVIETSNNSMDHMISLYQFTPKQEHLLNELLSEQYTGLWDNMLLII